MPACGVPRPGMAPGWMTTWGVVLPTVVDHPNGEWVVDHPKADPGREAIPTRALDPRRIPVNLAQNRTQSDRPPLRTEVDMDQGLILIVDGQGELLALTFAEAANLVEDISSKLDVVGWDQ